ncbi:MAG: histidinol-phosphate transaminase [Dehalococcoidales bacterium]
MAFQELDKLIRKELVNFRGYAASRAPETLGDKVAVPLENIIKLDANENAYGCSPRVTAALAEYSNLSVYPDPEQTEIRRQIQEYTGVDAAQVVATPGSDQLIDLTMRLFIEPGDEVINCVPSFALFQFFMALTGGKLVEVLRDDDFSVDIGKVKAAITSRTKMILLATPNNPTGTITPRPDIIELLETGVPVFVDEAYCEFGGETVVDLMPDYPNLMILRTFSKWAGLAGLRIGYGLFPPKIADYLMRIKEPYCVNGASMIAVRESFKDIDYLNKTVQLIIAEREKLFEELAKFTWLKPFPSRANFIYCAVLKGKAGDLQQKMQSKGILVRYFDQPLLKNSIRIGVGKPEHTVAVIKALWEIESEQSCD